MRKLMVVALAVTAVVALGCRLGGAATPDENSAGQPKTPAPAHDPQCGEDGEQCVNQPHSPQPRDKQVKVRVVVHIENPVRPSRITVLIGHRDIPEVHFSGELFFRDYTVSPVTYVGVVAYNGKVGGENVVGDLQCEIYRLNSAGVPAGPPVSRHDNIQDRRLPVGCEYWVQD